MSKEPDPPIRPTDLAAKLRISVPYASQLLSGARKPGISTALAIFDKTGLKFGVLENASAEQIAMLRQLAA